MELFAQRVLVLVACLLYGLTTPIRAEDICWSTYGNFQYKVLTALGGVSFPEAAAACEQENTTLVSVHSLEEDLFLQTFAMSQIGVPVWIGLNREGQNLSWIDGSEMTYINRNYRRKAYEQSCVYMFQGWIDAHCEDAELYFICKRNVIKANTCLLESTTLTSASESSTESQQSTAASNAPQTSAGFDNTPENIAEERNTTSREDVTSSTTTTVPDITQPNATMSGTETADELRTDSNQNQATDQQTTTTTSSTASTQKDHTDSPTDTVTTGKDLTPSDTDTTKDTPPEFASQSTTPHATTDGSYLVETPTWETQFEAMIKDMTVKEKPVYSTIEAENSAAIGSVSILILMGVVLGVVLLDITTIRNHLKLFHSNTKGFCSSFRKDRKTKHSDIIIELVDVIDT